jgi:hypothetical protein
MKSPQVPHSALLELIERAVLPALLERFLSEHCLTPSVARPTNEPRVAIESRSL